MSIYEGMLPKEERQGKIGYYPVVNKQEWEELPDLYKAMEWNAIRDPLDKRGSLRAVKSVTFDVVHMEPYGIRAKVTVHPEDVQKILFCSYGHSQCHLYSISGIELEGGTKLHAKWLQDSTTGAFAVVVNGDFIAIQGGFQGHVPECIEKTEHGEFKWKGFGDYKKINYYTYSEPFRDEKSIEQQKEKNATEKLMDAVAEFGMESGWSDSDVIDTLVGCGVTYEDFKKYGKEEFVKEYFEESQEEKGQLGEKIEVAKSKLNQKEDITKITVRQAVLLMDYMRGSDFVKDVLKKEPMYDFLNSSGKYYVHSKTFVGEEFMGIDYSSKNDRRTECFRDLNECKAWLRGEFIMENIEDWREYQKQKQEKQKDVERE